MLSKGIVLVFGVAGRFLSTGILECGRNGGMRRLGARYPQWETVMTKKNQPPEFFFGG